MLTLENNALKMRSKIWQTRRLNCRSFDSSSPCTPERTNLYLSSKEKGFHERDSFSISSLPSTRREIRESLPRNERHPRTLKNGWKKPGCGAFREHKNLHICLERSRAIPGNRPPVQIPLLQSVALQLFHQQKEERKKGRRNEVASRKFLLDHRSLASIGFRFQPLSPSENKERGAITGW